MLSVLLISGLAMGGEWIEVFDDPDYPDSTYMDGVDGWSSGYDEDDWYADGYYVASETDDNVDDDPDSKYNSFTNSAINAEDMYLFGWMATQDDDTMGFVFNQTGPDDYFAVMAIGSIAAPGASGSSSNPFGYGTMVGLIQVQDGEATLLDSVSRRVRAERVIYVQAGHNDGYVWANLWQSSTDDGSDVDWEDPDWELDRTVDGGGGLGTAGMYAYDAGGLSGSSWTWFYATRSR